MRSSQVACLTVALLGCGPTDKEKAESAYQARKHAALTVLDTNRDAYTTVLEPVIKAVVANPPPVTADGVLGIAAPLIDWANGGNTIVLMEWTAKSAAQKERLRPSTRDGKKEWYGLWEYHSTTYPADAISYWSGESKFSQLGNADDAKAVVDHIRRLQYVVVIRVLAFDAPQIKDTYDSSTKHVIPGHVVAEARIFDTKGADHGGFVFEGTHSGNASGRDMSQLSSALEHDLALGGEAAFQEKLAKLVPGSNVVFALK